MLITEWVLYSLIMDVDIKVDVDRTHSGMYVGAC